MTEIFRGLKTLTPLTNYTHSNLISLPEQEFFQQLDSIEQRIKASTGKWILFSHCQDQVLGFDSDLESVEQLNRIAEQYKDRVLIVVISVNKLELNNLIHYYFFPEYHAVYWPLYKSMTPTYRLNDVTQKYLCNDEADIRLSNSSFCAIVIEADISEKTVRALALGQPVLLLGKYGTHQYLKDLGFDLLDDILDNSFDQETETYARFSKFVSSIVQINQHSVGALRHLKASIKDRLRANRTRVEELHEEMNQRSLEIVQEVLHKFSIWS